VYATSSERGAVSASGGLHVGGLALPVKTIDRERIRVGGGGAVLTYRLRGRHWRESRQALRRGRRVVLRLGVVATDRSGKSTRRNAPAITLVGGEGASRASAIARAAHPEPGDMDGDGRWDWEDNCPTVKNGSQRDTNGDREGDACDVDDDGDGVHDVHPDGSRWDNCRIHANPDQTDMDGDGYGDPCPPVHSDSDGIIDDDDNCDSVPNPGQADMDGDEIGDACDTDVDGDGFDDVYDNCPTVYNIEPTDTDGDGFVNDQQDLDRDGVGTACDPDESVLGGPGIGGSKDRKRPRLAVRVTGRQRMPAVKAGLVVMLRCSEACDATVELEVRRRDARRLGLRRGRVLGGGSARLQGKGTTYAFVKFDRRARRKLFRMRSLRSRLTAVAVDSGGNRKRLERRLLLVR
jgi:hypothetical protein